MLEEERRRFLMMDTWSASEWVIVSPWKAHVCLGKSSSSDKQIKFESLEKDDLTSNIHNTHQLLSLSTRSRGPKPTIDAVCIQNLISYYSVSSLAAVQKNKNTSTLSYRQHHMGWHVPALQGVSPLLFVPAWSPPTLHTHTPAANKYETGL